jgi:Flp pilus assembly protein TadG
VNRALKWLADTRLGSEQGAQLVEFAVALPLLVVFVVGIFDFSTALTLKQRLENMARDAARAAASDPSNDLQGPANTTYPVSVMDVYYIVHNYLVANNLNDCGITPSPSASGLTWTFTASGSGCPSPGLTITVNRGYYYPVAGGTPSATCQSQSPGSQTAILSTCVSIHYAYPWRFGQAASLLGFSTMLPPQISGVAVSINEN